MADAGQSRTRKQALDPFVPDNRKAVATFSPGLPLRLPWVVNRLRPYRKAVAPGFDSTKK